MHCECLVAHIHKVMHIKYAILSIFICVLLQIYQWNLIILTVFKIFVNLWTGLSSEQAFESGCVLEHRYIAFSTSYCWTRYDMLLLSFSIFLFPHIAPGTFEWSAKKEIRNCILLQTRKLHIPFHKSSFEIT